MTTSLQLGQAARLFGTLCVLGTYRFPADRLNRPRTSADIGALSGEDVLNHRIGAWIILDVGPESGGQLTFGALVKLAVRRAAAEPVTNQEHPVHVGGSGREPVDLHARLIDEELVLIPGRLTALQSVADGLQVRDMDGLVTSRLPCSRLPTTLNNQLSQIAELSHQ